MFFTTDDKKITVVNGQVINWWSRIYEYRWVLDNIKSDDKIIDAGCGLTHPLKHELAKRSSKQVIAIDYDNKLMNYKGNNLINIIADIKDIPLPAESVDVIVCVSVIEHIWSQPNGSENVRKVINEFHRLLKKGGRVLLTIDYPTVDVEWILKRFSRKGFSSTDGDINRPANAVYEPVAKLYVWGSEFIKT